MTKRISKYFVNWIDGMRISRVDFITQEQAVRDHLRDTLSCVAHDAHYGLWSPAELEVEGSIARLRACSAICRDGSRVDLEPVQEQKVECDLGELVKGGVDGSSILLLVRAHLEQRVGHGPWEGEPPRQAHIAPRVSLEAVRTETFNESALWSGLLPIAKLVIRDDGVQMDAQYGPPSFRITSFPELERLRKDLLNTLDRVARGSENILKKLYGRHKELQHRFPNHCYIHWAQHSLLTTARIRAQLALGMERPFELFRSTIELALTLESVQITLPDRGDLLKHVEGIGNWASLIRTMGSAGRELSNMRHQHWDLGSSISAARTFLTHARDVYAQLGELDRFEAVLRDTPQSMGSTSSYVPPQPPPAGGPVLEWET